MPRIYSIRPTWSLKGRRFQGVRGFTGKPFHPPLTDFPIVCYSLAAIFDLISFFSDDMDPKAHDFFAAATFVMVAGFIVSLGAALTGFFDWWKGIPRDRTSGPIGRAKHTQVWRTINWHATVMLAVTAVIATAVAITANGGSLDAMMLDMKRTFDEIVEAHAEPGKAEAILQNPFYVALSSSFAGTQITLASGPLSSSIQNTPMARARMRQPGNVGSVRSTSASSGSPSGASVSGMKP